ncbi:hypothetical protein Psyc_1019 [Psychrobacter arcticus 273-4]|uniref:Uncharacterized protein n=1 Tax=Psychrobacter arcticus (strain DSM 17307 / VKM B-2377 / 273-4) TaxID=259536 RepID=Q4FSY6_PSYA2|nr:hypothetical protein [Psychrobacter arcticus]AAZ18872.1 hypothetical protein Psyc_1019 [Psychrobacter arcticus 273-4]
MINISTRPAIGDGATWACSTQFGAPQMAGNAGSNGQMLQVLDAILVNGFNSQVSTGIELLLDGFVKIKFGTAVGYQKRQKLLISGADDSNLNGEHIITQVIGNDFVIKAPAVTVTTGTITTKVAPLGWESIFGSLDPLKRAYRSKNPNTTQSVLYLDMTIPANSGYDATNPPKRAMVSICKDMVELGVQIGSYTDGTNDYATNPNGSLFWRQKHSGSSSGTAGIVTTSKPSPWTIVGNGDYFYFMVEWTSSTYVYIEGLKDLYCFGDMPSVLGSLDEWCCAWAGCYSVNDLSTSRTASFNGASIGSQDARFFISRHDGLIDMPGFAFSCGGVPGSYTSGNAGTISFPNPTSNSMIVSSIYSISSGALRSYVPRLLSVQHTLDTNYTLYNNTFIDGVLLVSMSNNNASTPSLRVAYFGFDMGD